MKKILLIALLCCVQALTPPDDEAILRATLDAGGPRYYPALMQRYAQGDRTLTAEDFYYLYYGYVYRDEYQPLTPSSQADSILMILEYSPEPDSIRCLEIIRLAQEVMRTDPFSPLNLNMMAYAHTILGNVEAAQLNADRVAKILATIKASGSGLTEKSPWVVLSFGHAEDVIKSLDLLPTSRRIVSRTVEYIDVGVRGQGKTKGYFFDFSRAYRNRPDQLPEPKRENGWMFNGIKLKSRR